VGRNYAEHAREMGADPDRSDPIFFSKPAASVTQAERVPYPPATSELHHEVELVALLGEGGAKLSPERAADCVAGWAVGCDLTRRDVQARAKAAGGPWALAKGFDASAPIGAWIPASEWRPSDASAIELRVNDDIRQAGRLGELIWSVPELLARLSREVTLHPGDIVFTGTPAGVGTLAVGDRVVGRIDGLPELVFEIAPSA
jgi:fumarylpyruvate hydrolase